MSPWRVRKKALLKIWSTWALKLCPGLQLDCGLGLFFLESTNIKEYVFARELEATDRVPTSSALPVSDDIYAAMA